jgi:phosphoribosyl-ATP pyrophosphohydrolase
MSSSTSVLARLMATIEQRRANPSSRSYTASLLAGGVEVIGGKVLEEAAEVVDAAGGRDDPEARAHLVHEAADLIYHLLVILAYRHVRLGDVETELTRRFGISGLEEKAARGSSPE